MTDFLELEGDEVSAEELCEWINSAPGGCAWPGGVVDDCKVS